MASSEFRKRANWQTISGFRALKTEARFKSSLQVALDSVFPDQFRVEKPKELGEIYSTSTLSDEVLDKIHNIDVTELRSSGTPKYSWGINMDFVIRNLTNKKSLFGAIKRQDGWKLQTCTPDAVTPIKEVANTLHHFTPGLLKVIRDASGISDKILPFWVVLVGDITRDPRRNREIAFWVQEYNKNFSMWRDIENIGDMLDFFENNLLPRLL